MKAYSLHAVNNLQYEEVPMPECKEGWAIVEVKASGICSSDVSRVFKSGTYHYPTILGHEFSGIVHSVGNSNDEHLIGKHVGVFPLIPCGECRQCRQKHYEMCEHYDYIGSRRDGGFAEYVAVPVWNLIVLPTSIPFTSAAMLEPLSVGLHAAKRAEVQPCDRIAIVGTGMIGISAAQWAKSKGAENVVVFGRNETKRGLVEGCGLQYRLISEESCDVFTKVIEAVGSPDSIDMALNLVSPGGTVVLMGNPTGDIPLTKNTYWRILRKQLTVTGTWNSSYDGTNPSDWTEAVKVLEEKEINVENLVSHVYNQERLAEGLKLMYDHKEPYCKVMTTWNK
jgi:L-iditol 2-dehydrogenase